MRAISIVDRSILSVAAVLWLSLSVGACGTARSLKGEQQVLPDWQYAPVWTSGNGVSGNSGKFMLDTSGLIRLSQDDIKHLQYEWTFPDNSALPATSAESTPEVVLGEAGDYRGQLRLRLQRGGQLFTHDYLFAFSVLKESSQVLEVRQVHPATVIEKTSQQFSAEIDNPLKKDLVYLWDFQGLGTPASATDLQAEKPTLEIKAEGGTTCHGTLTVWWKDDVNTRSSLDFTVEVAKPSDYLQARIAVGSVGPQTVFAGTTTQLSAVLDTNLNQTAASGEVGYLWDLSALGAVDNAAAEHPALTVSNLPAGDYPAHLTVYYKLNAAVNAHWDGLLTVTAATGDLRVEGIAPLSGIERQPVDFSASLFSDVSRPNLDYSWSFAHASPSTSLDAKARVVLGDAGAEQVSLTVRDKEHPTIVSPVAVFPVTVQPAVVSVKSVGPLTITANAKTKLGAVVQSNFPATDLRYQWELSTAGTADDPTTASPELTSVNLAPGQYSCKVLVYYALNPARDFEFPFKLTVPVDTGSIVIRSIAPLTAVEGTTVTFRADVTSAVQRNLGYAWDFGTAAQPSTSLEPAPQVKLGPAGAGEVKLRVWDKDHPEVDTSVQTFSLTIVPVQIAVVALAPQTVYQGTTPGLGVVLDTNAAAEDLDYLWDLSSIGALDDPTSPTPQLTVGNAAVGTYPDCRLRIYYKDNPARVANLQFIIEVKPPPP